MTAETLRPRRGPLLFALLATAVYAVGFSILHFAEPTDLLAMAVTLDLTLFVPALYLLLVVRTGEAPAATVAPVLVAGLVAAAVMVPEELRPARVAIEVLAIGIELGLLTVLGYRAFRARRGYAAAADGDPLERLTAAAREAVGENRAADIVAYEAAVLWYALLSWRRPGPVGDHVFTVHRRAGWGAVVFAVLAAIAIEIIPVHALLARWSPLAAWVVTGLSVYGAVWLIGDWHAMRLRPTTLESGTLRLRMGLRWSADVPVEWIRSAVTEREAGFADGPALEVALANARRITLELDRPVTVAGPYGMRRQTTRVALGVDDPERLATALARTAL